VAVDDPSDNLKLFIEVHNPIRFPESVAGYIFDFACLQVDALYFLGRLLDELEVSIWMVAMSESLYSNAGVVAHENLLHYFMLLPLFIIAFIYILIIILCLSL